MQIIILKIIAVVLIFISSVLIFYLFLYNLERIVCSVRHQIPFVPSNKDLRNAVIKEIKTHYPNIKTACDIGSGYGGLARKISGEFNIQVWALENMPFSAFVSKIMDIITHSKSKTVLCDAFEYIKKSDGFDIAIAYLGPSVNPRLTEIKNKTRVLVTMDVPVKGLNAVRTIDLPNGATMYGRERYPHILFVYEF
jgi:hypothetical protein